MRRDSTGPRDYIPAALRVSFIAKEGYLKGLPERLSLFTSLKG